MKALNLFLLLTATCTAQEPGGVYRLVCDVPGKANQSDIGSCVGIPLHDTRQHFLTLAHVIGPNLRIEHDGESIPCEVVESWDSHLEPVYLIRTVKPSRLRIYEIATDAPQAGQSVFVVGFPFGKWKGWQTRIESVQTAYGSHLLTKGPIDRGTSGGAVLSEDGRLVGLVHGSDSNVGLSVNVVELIQRIRNKPKKVQLVQWNCGNGYCRPSYCYPSAPVLRSPRPSVVKPAPRLSVDLSGVEGRLSTLEARLNEIAARDSVTPAELQSAANLLTIEIDRLSGENAELRGRVTAAEKAIAGLQSRKRTVRLTSDGKLLDEESYAIDEPIILDLKAITKK